MNQFTLLAVSTYLDISDLVNCSKISIAWKTILAAVVDLMISKFYNLQTLPPSFSTWIDLYKTYTRFQDSKFDFVSFENTGLLPKGNFETIRRKGLNQGLLAGYQQQQFKVIPKKHRRYVAVIPIHDSHHLCICLTDRLYYLKKNSDEKIIIGLDLNTGEHIILLEQRNCIHLMTGSARFLVTFDVMLKMCIWNPSQSLQPIQEVFFDQKIISIDAEGDHLAILMAARYVQVWNLSSGSLIDSFKLPLAFGSSMTRFYKPRIKIKDTRIGVWSAHDIFVIYERLKAPKNYGAEYKYYCKFHSMNEDSYASDFTERRVVPSVFELAPGFILTAGSNPEDVCVNVVENQHLDEINMYDLASVPNLSKFNGNLKTTVLTEEKAMMPFGIQLVSQGFILFATIDIDSSMILGITATDDIIKIIAWDFRINRVSDRYFERVNLDGIDLFTVYDDISQKINYQDR